MLIGEHVSDCRDRPVEWKLKGTVVRSDLLREMSAVLCEGFLVPKSLMQLKVTLAVEPSTRPALLERMRGVRLAETSASDSLTAGERRFFERPKLRE